VQLNSVIEIYQILTLVAMVTKIWNFNTRPAISWLI